MNELNYRYQRLATAVLAQAIVDLDSKIQKAKRSAHYFLFADDDQAALRHWSAQAGFEPTEVVRLLKRTTPEALRRSLDSERVRRF